MYRRETLAIRSTSWQSSEKRKPRGNGKRMSATRRGLRNKRNFGSIGRRSLRDMLRRREKHLLTVMSRRSLSKSSTVKSARNFSRTRNRWKITLSQRNIRITTPSSERLSNSIKRLKMLYNKRKRRNRARLTKNSEKLESRNSKILRVNKKRRLVRLPKRMTQMMKKSRMNHQLKKLFIKKTKKKNSILARINLRR
jgi:hypothetical protein